ncbi:hypothetical protein LguiA_025714 [Lonicera macranthoides]
MTSVQVTVGEIRHKELSVKLITYHRVATTGLHLVEVLDPTKVENQASLSWCKAITAKIVDTIPKMGDETPVYTLDEALSTIGFGKFQGLVLAYAGLGWVAEAMEMMLLSFVGPALETEWGLSSAEESMISTVVFAGMLLGAYAWGLVSDTFGRRKVFLGAAILCSGAGFLSAFSPNYISLVTLRGLLGIGLGSGHVLISWFLEFVPTPNRGTWMVIFSGFWTVGAIFEASLAWIIIPRLGWRWLLAVSSIPWFCVVIFYGLTPESPRFLCMKGRTTEAHDILKNGALLNRKKLPHGILVSDDHITELNEDYALLEDTHLISLIEKKPKNSSMVPGLVLSGIIVDRVGRKLSMEIMFILGFILLLPLVTAQHEILTTASLFGARMFISATFTVACIYAPEGDRRGNSNSHGNNRGNGMPSGSSAIVVSSVGGIGANWGTQASHPLPPETVVRLLRENGIQKVGSSGSAYAILASRSPQRNERIVAENGWKTRVG